jgi:hypothetical protein
MKRTRFSLVLAVPAILVSVLLALPSPAASAPSAQQGDNPNPPDHAVKLIFIHHSTGENWLRDDYGGLGQALANNNYFVSDTNYGWGPNSIGDRTDIPDWLEWFQSADTPTYLEAVYNESGQNSSYTRLPDDPGGGNEIVLFKSCFPNSGSCQVCIQRDLEIFWCAPRKTIRGYHRSAAAGSYLRRKCTGFQPVVDERLAG